MVYGSGCMVQGLWCMVQVCLGSRIWVLGFMVQGLSFRVGRPDEGIRVLDNPPIDGCLPSAKSHHTKSSKVITQRAGKSTPKELKSRHTHSPKGNIQLAQTSTGQPDPDPDPLNPRPMLGRRGNHNRRGMRGSGSYRGTWRIRTPPPVGPYSSPMPRDLR